MLNRTKHAIINFSKALFTIAVLISFAALTAPAAEDPQHRSDSSDPVKSEAPEARAAEPAKPTIPLSTMKDGASYVLYSDLTEPGGPDPARMTRPRTVSYSVPSLPRSAVPPAPSPTGSPAASTAPMTPGEKFGMFFKGSFLSIGAYAGSIFTGAWGEWTDDDHHHHASNGDYAADSMTRAARSFTSKATNSFFEKFFYPTLFKQDPRYHRSGQKGAMAKIRYAISRTWITQGDNNGKDQFNISFLAGAVSGAAMANLWERPERQDLEHFGKRLGTHIGFSIAGKIVREFIGGQ
jgi:hypothetical protein